MPETGEAKGKYFIPLYNKSLIKLQLLDSYITTQIR